MFRTLALAIPVAVALVTAGARRRTVQAQGRLSGQATRSAVENGNAVSLSRWSRRSRRRPAGNPADAAALRQWRPVGLHAKKEARRSVETLTVDAASGNIAGY
jgi:hypothetical protein